MSKSDNQVETVVIVFSVLIVALTFFTFGLGGYIFYKNASICDIVKCSQKDEVKK
jgi:hypothetical protein